MTTSEEFKEWSSSGNWLSTKVLEQFPNQEAVGVITSLPELQEREIQGKHITKLYMKVEVNKQEYDFDMGKRDGNVCAEKFGSDLTSWHGKMLKFSIIPTNLGKSVLARPYNIQQPQPQQPAPTSAGSGSPFSTKPHIPFNNQGRIGDTY